MTSDERYEFELVLNDAYLEAGVEHSASCYVQQVGNGSGEEFWVCGPWCPTIPIKNRLLKQVRVNEAERLAMITSAKKVEAPRKGARAGNVQNLIAGVLADLRGIAQGIDGTETGESVNGLIGRLREAALDFKGEVNLSAASADRIEDALSLGFENCGEDPDCAFAEALGELRRLRREAR